MTVYPSSDTEYEPSSRPLPGILAILLIVFGTVRRRSENHTNDRKYWAVYTGIMLSEDADPLETESMIWRRAEWGHEVFNAHIHCLNNVPPQRYHKVHHRLCVSAHLTRTQTPVRKKPSLLRWLVLGIDGMCMIVPEIQPNCSVAGMVTVVFWQLDSSVNVQVHRKAVICPPAQHLIRYKAHDLEQALRVWSWLSFGSSSTINTFIIFELENPVLHVQVSKNDV